MKVHLYIFQLRANISKQQPILQYHIHINGLVKIGYYLLKNVIKLCLFTPTSYNTVSSTKWAP